MLALWQPAWAFRTIKQLNIYIFVGERVRACMCVNEREKQVAYVRWEISLSGQVMKTLPAHQRESVLTTLNLIRHSHIHSWWFCSLSVCECLWRKPHCKIFILRRFVPVKGPLHSSWKSRHEEHLKNVLFSCTVCLRATIVDLFASYLFIIFPNPNAPRPVH